MHATTALQQPDRFDPTRIGLVFYQHKRLTLSRHGYWDLKKRRDQKMENDYQNYWKGKGAIVNDVTQGVVSYFVELCITV